LEEFLRMKTLSELLGAPREEFLMCRDKSLPIMLGVLLGGVCLLVLVGTGQSRVQLLTNFPIEQTRQDIIIIIIMEPFSEARIEGTHELRCHSNLKNKDYLILAMLEREGPDCQMVILVEDETKVEILASWLQRKGAPTYKFVTTMTEAKRRSAWIMFEGGLMHQILIAPHYLVPDGLSSNHFLFMRDMAPDIDSFIDQLKRVKKYMSILTPCLRESRMAEDIEYCLQMADQEVPDWLQEEAEDVKRGVYDDEYRRNHSQ